MNAVVDVKPEQNLPVSQPEPLSSATSLIQVIERIASNPNINLEIMDRLFAHHKEMVAHEAEVAFNDAMSACQSEMPAVERDAENEQTHSWYTRLETLSDAAVPIYTKHGFSLSFDEEDSPKEGHIRVICYCSHKAGYTRKYRGDVPLDIAGIKGNVNKTPTHAFGSTKSYGRRYLTLDIFNIVMKGEDNDGNGQDRSQYITEKQAEELKAKIKKVGANEVQFMKFLKVDKLADLPAKKYAAAIQALEDKGRGAR